jgi:hypothetical protein
MRVLTPFALAGALVIGLTGATMANTTRIDMDNGSGAVVKRTTHATIHKRTTHRRVVNMRRSHRAHRWAMHRAWRGYGYAAPMYGYAYGSSAPAQSSQLPFGGSKD